MLRIFVPKHEVVDSKNVISWVRYPDGSYVVDQRHLREFKVRFSLKNTWLLLILILASVLYLAAQESF